MLKYKLVLTEEMNRLLDGIHPAIYHHGVLSRIAEEGQTFYEENIPTFRKRLTELRETFPWPDIVLREKQTMGVHAGTVDDTVQLYEVALHPPRSFEQHSVGPTLEPDDQDLFGVLIGRLVSEINNR